VDLQAEVQNTNGFEKSGGALSRSIQRLWLLLPT
jgi:hypothetical protein